MDYTGSIGYNTSRALADLLGPLVDTTENHVKNSKELAEKLSSFILEQEDIFNSHDVVSLFTKTPMHETLTIIRERLEKDQDLKKRTNLEVADTEWISQNLLPPHPSVSEDNYSNISSGQPWAAQYPRSWLTSLWSG